MKSRIPIPALLVAALTLVAAAGGTAINFANGVPADLSAVGLVTFLAFPAMGLLIVRHQRESSIGWLLLGIGLSVYLIFGAADYGQFAVIRHPGVLPAGEAVTWISTWVWIPFFLMVIRLAEHEGALHFDVSDDGAGSIRRGRAAAPECRT